MAKTHHRRRRRHANRTRRGGAPKKMTPKKWAESLLSEKSRSYFFDNAGIHKPPKHKPSPGDTSAPARDRSRMH
jgi:hypothetical protein